MAKLDLRKIGVPFPSRENGCKIVFTTRSQEVCGSMGVDVEMEVQCLAPNDALDLFKKKVGEITLRSDPNIPELAIAVAKKCQGLPLTLNVIGEAMASKQTVQEWQHAIYVLNSYAIEFSGMEDQILPLLKYSYDNIKEDRVRSCLLYCSLFPEDYEIPKEKLIDYWIGEGIIDGSEGIERAENKGYEIIGSLVRASLLMEVEEDFKDCVCMHDVVREMALWIASDLRTEKEAFIVHAGVGSNDIPTVNNWSLVKRMSLMNNKIRHLAGGPECLELKTLLMQKNFLENISSEFFKSTPKLVVLDLSQNGKLSELPEGISQLVSLQYLDLSRTGIHHLPKGLQELKKLIHLDLQYTVQLSGINGISRLHNLKVLNLSFSGFSWDLSTMEELETLEHLQVLITGFRLPLDLEQFLSSHRLTSCTRFIMISEMDLESSGISIPVTMEKLRKFIIIFESRISEIKICNKSKTVSPLHNPRNICFSSLSYVVIQCCKCLRELTWLIFAQNLRTLVVSNADDLEDIINKEKASECEESGIAPFPKLIYFKLSNLPMLKNIYWRSLPFPCLKKIRVIGCRNLKKLPFNSQSGTHGEDGLIIRYREKEWIEGVEWEDEATKTRFLSLCREDLCSY